ncbi:hypothetical protein [Dyadobacter luticola]|uniref:Uncharacterized protein n=1 Tax=Dyadobacter luticola TaxID=1979387 RepID=A0A5R9KV62_9BACT|nr:hypothetical protein [Dyadobacter luticola]TLV00124.1 hypothetical protein FEN17_11475 [Dyadobacter luticola]
MKKYIVIALLVLVGFALYSVGRFYVWKAMDYRDRPWAFSSDESKPLLIGKWQGSFADPDLVSKKIILEILNPEPDSVRWEIAFDTQNTSYDHTNWKSRFEGKALVTSKLGDEHYNVSGLIKGEEGHKFQLFFTSDETKKKVLPNFSLSETNENASWEGDKMDFQTKFSYYKSDGVLLYQSGDPQHNKVVAVHLERVK